MLSEEADEPRKQRARASVAEDETEEEEAPAPLGATAKASACDGDGLAVKGGCLDREAVRQRAGYGGERMGSAMAETAASSAS